jgi:hypothetical protein
MFIPLSARGRANVVHDEITVIDRALTRPWTVDKKYLHNPNPRPNWIIGSCGESSMLVGIGRDAYALSADGLLIPIQKNQALMLNADGVLEVSMDRPEAAPRG